jgi:formylmethanofuran dehydrogenase subunit B
MPNPSQDPSKPDPRIVEDATCTFCGCLCDDICLRIEDDRVVGAGNACSLGESWFMNRPADDWPICLVEGQAATLEEGIDRATRILVDARYPVIYGLAETTSEAQRLAVAIADRIGGCIDASSGADSGASTIAFQEVGEVTCTLGEVKNRGDLIVFWGCDPAETDPRFFERYALTAKGTFVPRGREDRHCIVVDRSKTASAEVADQFIPIAPRKDFEAFWTLRALAKGIALDAAEIEAETGVPISTWQDLLNRMKQAKYGVIFHGGESNETRSAHLDYHALLAFVRDLNDVTRFVCLPMRGRGNLTGAENVITSQTGYPSPVNLARGHPRYGPGEFNASISLERHESDAALIVAGSPTASLSPAARDHLARIPCIVIGPSNTRTAEGATVRFHSATDGINTPGTVYRMDGVPIPLRPAVASMLPGAEAILRGIAQGLRAIPRADNQSGDS